MKAVYPTNLTKDGNTILVEVPDLGILTEGKNMQDAIYMARDAIGSTGISMQDHGEAIPEPSDIGDINVSKGTFADVGEGIKTLVDIDFDAYRKTMDRKMVRRNVTLPSWMDARAAAEHINVSKVLQEALMQKFA